MSVAFLRCEGKNPVAKEALNMWQSLCIMLGGRCWRIVVLTLLGSGVLFLVCWSISATSLGVIGVLKMFVLSSVVRSMVFAGCRR